MLERASQAPVSPFLQFIFDAHLIFPDEIIELRRFRVHEHGGSLQILDEGLFAEVGQLLNQHLVQSLLWFGFSSFVKENEIFAQFDVGGLVGDKLPHHHHTGENQDREKTQNVLMFSKKTHEFVIVEEFPIGNLFG
jgi:hypothetical protein